MAAIFGEFRDAFDTPSYQTPGQEITKNARPCRGIRMSAVIKRERKRGGGEWRRQMKAGKSNRPEPEGSGFDICAFRGGRPASLLRRIDKLLSQKRANV